MLILTRRIGEKLIIDTGNEKMEAVILGVRGSQVRLGIEAPSYVSVDREEIALRKQEEAKQ